MTARTNSFPLSLRIGVLVVSACSLLTGCPDFGDQAPTVDLGNGSGSGEPQFTYCADIKPIFDASCGRCHGEGPAGGQYPDLDVYAERQAGWGSVSTDLDSSLNRINIGDMPPVGEPDPAVTARQLAIIEAWKAQGAPEGSCN